MKTEKLSTIVDSLERAAATRSFSSAEPWNYGWSVQGYRDSPQAAMTHDAHRAVSLDRSGVAAFEQATNSLLRLPDIVACYDGEEFWGIMASLVGSLPIGDMRGEIERRVTRLVSPPNSLAVLPLANIAPFATPIRLGPVTVGPFDVSMAGRLEATGKATNKNPWWATATSENELTTVVAYESRAQSRLALREAEQAFDDVVAIALALEPDLDAMSLFSLRGDAHRPGTRGIAIDRAALSRMAKSVPEIRRELGADGIVLAASSARL